MLIFTGTGQHKIKEYLYNYVPSFLKLSDQLMFFKPCYRMSAIMDLWHGSVAVLTVLATLYIPWELHSLLLLLKSLANLQLTRNFETEILIKFSLLLQHKYWF